ncbi:MAG: SusC/RagA family TonB-linked outer membrane protein [Bacteroidota bacterium]
MKKNSTAFGRAICLLLVMLGCLNLQAQPSTKTITGKVTDENNAGLSGVTISSKEGKETTTSQTDGSFSLNTSSSAKTLVLSYVGYLDLEVPITGIAMGNIKLAPDPKALESVVVVGYGSRKKTDVTAAISSVTGEKLRSVPTTNLTQALQGRVTGVEAAASSFAPGAGSRIRIRGSRSLSAGNDPLYVVDGFPVSYTIDDMNPLDIETIDILKDASATAIYGVRGANGVVQITTKKGKAGKISMEYSGSQSYEHAANVTRVFNGAEIADSWRQAFFADRQYNYTQSTASPNNYFPDARSDARMFLELGNANQWNSLKDAYSWRVLDPVNKIYIANKRPTTAEEKALLKNLGLAVLDSLDIYDPSKVKSYDWENEGKRVGITKSHAISISAGTDKIKTTFSGSYFNQKGIQYGQDYTRFTVGNSNEFKVNKNIMFGSTVNFTNSTQNTSTSSLGNALGMIPLAPAYDSTGAYILYPNGDRQIASAINDRNTVFDETIVNRVFGNIYGEATIIKGLKFRTMFGLDTRNSRRGTFNGAASSVQQGALANASQTVSNSVSWVWDNILSYNTTIGDHSINVTGLYELQKLNRGSSLTMSAQNLIFEEQKWYSLQRNTLATVTGSGTFTEAEYLSYMGRLEYGYKNKYLLTVSNRYDNSSVLAEGKKGEWFPSASIAWRVENEGFFSKQSLFNAAKIRLGIGKVGNASIDPYQTNGPLDFTNYNWGNGAAAIGLAPTTFRTPGLTWEKTTTKNLGIDFGLLRNRISGSIDLYSSSTVDMLQRKSIPAANGVTTVFVNLGEVTNKGIEFSLSTQNLVSKNGINWSTDFVFSRNKEKIVDIDGSGNSNFANLWLLGQPLQVYYNYPSSGIFQYSDTIKGGVLFDYYWQKAGNRTNSALKPGAIRIGDTNRDTLLNASDKVVLGSHNADWTGSITNTISFKNIELNFMIYFRVGGLYRAPRPGFVGRYQSNYANYWTPTNPSNEYQQPTRTTDVPVFWEALSYRKASYARVRNISLTYRLPQSILAKLHASSMSVYLNALNPFLFHNASIYDPETAPYRETFVTSTNQVGPTSTNFRSFVVGVRLGL